MNKSERLKQRVLELARNLWWTWHPEALDVWRSIDAGLYVESVNILIAAPIN
jgi:hypothetical protein